MLEGIERVRLRVDGQVRDLITGLHEVKIKILRLFSEQVCHVYQLPAGSEGGNCDRSKSYSRKCSTTLLNVGIEIT